MNRPIHLVIIVGILRTCQSGTGAALKWFNNYITKRKQGVRCNGETSSPSEISIGVPQGRVLGPALFLIYIHDITQSVNFNGTSYNIFADDVVIYTTGGDIDDVNHELQFNIDSISDWCECNRLSINPDKTKIMLLSSSRANTSDKLNISLKNTQL